MSKKIAGLIIIIALSLAGWYYFKYNTFKEEKPKPVVEKQIPEPVKQKEEAKPEPKQAVKPVIPIKKSYDLYSQTPYDLPLISIMEISELPENIKNTIDELLEKAQGFYLLKMNDGKIFIILQNPVNSENTYSRHDLEFAEINPDGTLHCYFAGYSGEDGETALAVTDSVDKDDWKFDKSTEPYKPLKHIKRDESGKIMFTEIWDYSSDADIKYEMKNSKGKAVSVLRETLESDTNYLKEHVFYDEDGNTKMSVSINYDGANITRFTYYTPQEGISVMSEYTDGVKTKESVYNSNYELVNILKAAYENGERTSITLLDKNEAVLKKIER